MLIALIDAASARPTDGGLWSFSDEDTVTSVDSASAAVRVWYSTSGPNAVLSDDDDADGIPDFAADVAAVTEDVLAFYANAGFRPPLSDGARGGGEAMDVYLVDFGGSADGLYSAETCSSGPRQCSGYFVMENDFSGYGYSDVASAIRVLTSHELFHAVQAAYDADEEVWFSEGTAVWAEELYDPLNEDFLYFCDAYLGDAGRSLDQPPAGPVPTFAYATALWWWYLGDRHGDDLLVALLEATETSDDILVDMAALEEAAGSSLAEDFSTFARWNLATGNRAGLAESYPFAADIGGIRAEANGSRIVEDARFYPLAATYYKLDHPGGELWFATGEDAPDLAFSLHGQQGDPVTDALAEFGGLATATSLGELAAGDYWLVVSNPTLAEDSTKVLICLGNAADVEACVPPVAEDVPKVTEDDCGCDAGSGAIGWWALAAIGLARRRYSSVQPSAPTRVTNSA